MNTKSTKEKLQDYFGLCNTIFIFKNYLSIEILVNSNTKT